MRVVMLDSAVDDQIPGELDDAQLTWLEKTLVQPCSLPTVVALHHPPCGTAVRETNGNNLMRPEAFLEILERHPVTAVLAGHKHTASATSHKGIPVCTGAGVAFAIQMPQGGRLRFVKEMTVQYCALYDDRFYWSPIRPEGGEVIFEMTPKEMRDYHAKK